MSEYIGRHAAKTTSRDEFNGSDAWDHEMHDPQVCTGDATCEELAYPFMPKSGIEANARAGHHTALDAAHPIYGGPGVADTQYASFLACFEV